MREKIKIKVTQIVEIEHDGSLSSLQCCDLVEEMCVTDISGEKKIASESTGNPTDVCTEIFVSSSSYMEVIGIEICD